MSAYARKIRVMVTASHDTNRFQKYDLSITSIFDDSHTHRTVNLATALCIARACQNRHLTGHGDIRPHTLDVGWVYEQG